jgi:hypothetical protein
LDSLAVAHFVQASPFSTKQSTTSFPLFVALVWLCLVWRASTFLVLILLHGVFNEIYVVPIDTY